ncbi:MAG TPA: CHAT domain-containing tetratricopeptide repeat protein [Thermoanaerobaculia bacterium]
MSLSPVSRRFTPRFRGVFSLFLPLAALLCGAAQPPSPPGPSLTDGLVLERDLKAGETHSYPVDLQAGQFLRVRAQEEGIDVTLRLRDPQGAVVTGSDGHSEEDLAVVGSVSGLYRVEVVSAQEKASPGRYRLRVEGPRTAGDQDKLRSEAVKAFWEAGQEPGKDEEALRRKIRSVERAVSLWHQLGETRREAEALYFLGVSRFNLPGAAEQSLTDFQASASLWGTQPDREARDFQVRSLNSMGRLLRRLGRLDEARQRYQEALVAARQVGDVRDIAASLNNLGVLDCQQGELRQGIASLTESLEKAREGHHRDIQVSDLLNLAIAYERLQELQKALQYEQEALELARAARDPELEAIALNNLGETYLSLGDWETAVSSFQKVLPLIHRLGDRANEARTLINLGDAFRRLERFKDAEKAFDQALVIGREVKDTETQTAALTTRAFLYIKLHQPDRAVEQSRQALLLAQGFPDREVNALFALGRAHQELGDWRAAREELERALSLARSRGDRAREAEIGLILAWAERDGGDLAAAREQVHSAVELLESLRTRVLDPRLRTSFLATKQDFYEFYIDSLMSLQRPSEALQISERARARSLLDILTESGADLRKGADPALVDRERRLRDRINVLDRNRFNLQAEAKPDPRKLAEAERQLEQALDEYNQVQADLRASSPSYAALTQPQPLSVAEIQAQILDGKALLLEYALGAKRSFLWVVTPDSIRSFELPRREQIEKTARRYYELLTARNERRPAESLQAWKQRVDRSDQDAGRVGRDLYRLLLGPAERLLGDHPLLIVADGALQYIPFAALPVPSSGAPLVTRHEVVSLPSASALAALRREVLGRSRAPKTLAVFADPVFQATDPRLTHRSDKLDRMSLASTATRGWAPTEERQAGGERPSFRRLLSSRKEAETLSSLVPRDQLSLAIGFDASRARATAPELAQYRNVHFATHGVLDSRRPELSKLVLSLYDEKGKSEDGFLRLNDIYSLHLNADLVVLSACQTALGKEIRGEGLIGLTRGFMDAGAARVVASLWSVEDRATAELMGSFYRAMLREKLSPAAALRQAQIRMASTPGHQSPYFWAGFALQGEWK